MFAIILSRRLKINFKGHRKALILGSIIITSHFLVQFTGIKFTSATNTGWLCATIPLVTAVMAYFILKEHIGRNVIIGIIVATIGIVLLISRGKLADLSWISSIGDWLVLVSSFTWALYTIATRNLVRACNPLSATFVILLVPTSIGFIAMLFFSNWSGFLKLPFDAVISLLYLGIFGTSIAHWFWQEGVARIGASRAGIYLYLEPLATTALAVPYMNEYFGAYTAIGGLLVLIGVWTSQKKMTRKPL